MAGRGFGKTRLGAEWVRESVKTFEFVNLIAPTADDARDIMVEGESGLLAICPPWERPEYQPSKRQLVWPNGAKSLIFTADEPERLRGKQHMRVWADEIAAWRYPESWVQMTLGLRIGTDPRAVATTTPKPVPLIRELVNHPDCVVTRGATYDNLENLADAFAEQIIRQYEGTRLGRQELEGELLEDEGLAYRFDDRVHVVPPFDIPRHWQRFGSLDYGWTNPSALLYWTVDTAGNVIVYDGLYEPGWPSELVPKIRERRPPGTVHADPSMWIRASTSPKFGDPASPADEFALQGFPLVKANNNRRAGYMRLAELLKLDPEHPFPDWHPMQGTGSPRLFIADVPGTVELREQIRWAPLEEAETGPYQGPHPGEAVAVKWESGQGHAHASLRYGAMTLPSPSKDRPVDMALYRRTEPDRDPGELQREFLQDAIERRQTPPRRRTYVP